MTCKPRCLGHTILSRPRKWSEEQTETKKGAEQRKQETHSLSLEELHIDIVVLWRLRHLEGDLDESSRELLDGDELSKSGLQDALEVSFPRAFIYAKRHEPRSTDGLASETDLQPLQQVVR
jgi:hypothetical protein